VTLKRLAAQAHLSPSHLSALLARQLRTGFKRLLILLRLRYTARLLEQDADLGIGEASEAAGFAELRYCERSFRDHFGCSPSEYRRHLAAGDPRPSPAA
jgi:AraC-like DNA-binding protein